MNSSAPIGVFDSGVGGLSVLHAIRAALPHEDLCYVADSGHVPYGTKTPEYLQQRSTALTEFLLTQGIKALVVACNTATVAAVKHLRSQYSIPIIAVEPGIKAAASITKTGAIGVIATAATLESFQFMSLIERFGSDIKILQQACPHLVKQVEDGDLTSPATRTIIQHYTEPLLAADIDALVLGCTHYPFLRPLIDEVVGSEVTIIDTGSAIARQVLKVLTGQNLLNPAPQPGQETFWTSGEIETAQSIFSTLWQQEVNVQRLPEPFR
ncbi:glutamate racemase [Nodosilinea nodulosa]|uniref:glutamate racemase n=1 Tax=Nodosilinea nodulosa TaxID=416001 RepID=UPI000593C7CD|nr:glutamate racemase [Nodosilinea nodulosa]